MGTRHELKTSGAWVELREVEEITAKQRKRALATLATAMVERDDGEIVSGNLAAKLAASSDLVELVAAMVIERWEVPYLGGGIQPQATVDDIGDLRLDDWDRLSELVEPAVRLLMPRSSNNPDDYGDPASPSEPASD